VNSMVVGGSKRVPECIPGSFDRSRRGGLHCVAGLCIAAVVAGCASAPKPAQLTGGSIEATAQLNPSVNKRPSPLVLRLYELKNATAFNSADFVALYERDKAELAADIVSREEIILQPGETRPVAAKTLALEVKFIAVMGAFRDLERSQWRSVAAVLPGQKQRIVIRADGLAVSVTVSK
jgi:type VI secretion system protein VasD